MKNLITRTLHQILLAKPNKANKTFGTHSTHKGDEKFIQNFGQKS
jgi:hypothetical protein